MKSEYLDGVEPYGEELSYCGVPYVAGEEWIVNCLEQPGGDDLATVLHQNDGAEGPSRPDTSQPPKPVSGGRIQLITTIESSVCSDVASICRTMSQQEISPAEEEKIQLLKQLMGYDPALLKHLLSQVENRDRELGVPLQSSHVAAPFDIQEDAGDTDPMTTDEAGDTPKLRLRRHSDGEESATVTDASVKSTASERVTRYRTAMNKVSRVGLTGWSVEACQVKGVPTTGSQTKAPVQFRHAGPAVDGAVGNMKFTVMKIVPQNYKELFCAKIKANGAVRYVVSPHDLSSLIDSIAEQYAGYRSIERSSPKEKVKKKASVEKQQAAA